MRVVVKEDYEVLCKYRELIERSHNGSQVTVTVSMWDGIFPVVTRYYQYRGIRTCAFCVTELLGLAYKIIESYEKEG